jgi:hypothetical protein
MVVRPMPDPGGSKGAGHPLEAGDLPFFAAANSNEAMISLSFPAV